MKLHRNDRIALWWYSKMGMFFLSMYTEVFRMVQRPGDKPDIIIFKCLLPQAWDFADTLDNRDILEVRYVAEGVMDNPRNGRSLYFIRDIVRKDQWHNKLAPLDPHDAEALTVYLHAECAIHRVL